jgi:acyl-CoA thioesterase
VGDDGEGGTAAGGPTGSRVSPSALHERIATDPYGRWLGIELLELRPGYCRAGLTLASHMVNFHGSPHGGAIFSLADFVFGAPATATANRRSR